MSTITKYILAGQETQPFREALDVTVSAIFGLEVQASVSIDSVTFVDTDSAKNSQKVIELWTDIPTEGATFSLNINNNNNINYDFNFYLDYTRMRFLSAVETEVALVKCSSLEEIEFRSKAITMRLLEFKNFLPPNQFTNVPYIVENRKTILEKIQLLVQTFIILKMIKDEIFKIINILADITSAGIVQALFNLTTTILNLIVLVIELRALLIEIQDTFFPPVRYHSGIKPRTFIQQGMSYLGIDSVAFGTLETVMNELVWLGSKNNQKGITDDTVNPDSGILTPSNVGYNLFDCIELLSKQFRLKKAIIGGVFHLRPENDPFWVNSANYVMPSILIEQTFANNGTIRPNYEDLNSSTIIDYVTDDSDLHTLDDLANEADPTSTGKIISVTTVTPLVVTEERRVLLRNLKTVEIPYALAVRKNELTDLFQTFSNMVDTFNSIKSSVEDFFSGSPQSAPELTQMQIDIQNRIGALKIENHFFSVPKMILLRDNENGVPRIPLDFVDIIGARALYDNYHTWDSFIPGNRNPNNAQETAAKLVHEGVRIPFGLEDFNNILINSYFSTQDGKIGKFTKVDWNVRGDFAITDFWVYDNWMTNIEENIS